MALGTSLSAAKCISVSPVLLRTSAMLSGSSAPQPRMTMRSPACRTRSASSADAFHRRVALAAGQHAADLAADQRFERLGRVARHVEGAVAGDVQGPAACASSLMRFSSMVPSAFRQPTTTPATPRSRSARDIGEHRAVFGLAVEKIAAARPHDDVERHGRLVERGAHRAEARRDAAFDQAGAQFDPVGAGGLRGQQAVNAFDADFDQRQARLCGQGAIQSMMSSHSPSIGPVGAKARTARRHLGQAAFPCLTLS